MSRKSRYFFNIFIIVFFSICISQWFFTQREDWPWSYFGMYKERSSPQDFVSYKLWGQTWDNKTIDVYSLGSFNGYAFLDKTEEIILDKKISPTNETISMSETINLDKSRLNQMVALAKSDLEPYLNHLEAHKKIKSFSFELKHWKTFTWNTRTTPDLHISLIKAYYRNNSWQYDSNL